MVADSVLGRLYDYWRCCRLFALLRAIYRPFSRAWPCSAAARFLRRESRLELYYRGSLIDRIISGIFDFLLRCFAAIGRALGAPWGSSRIVGLCRGSFVFNFEFLLCAFICFMFIVPHDYWSNSLAFLGALGLFGLFFVMSALGKRKFMYPRELGLPFLLFALACALSLIFTTARGDSLRVLMFFVSAFLLCWVVASDIDSREKLMRLMGYIYLAVMLTSLFALYQRAAGVEVSSSFTDLSLNKGVPGRVFSTLDNPNNFAEFLVLFTPLCAAWALNVKNEKLRLPLFLLLGLPALSLLMTYSRSSWLSIFLAVLIFVYYSDKKLLPLLLLLCVVAVPFLPSSVMTRLGTIFNTRDSSANHRLVTWGCILDMLGDKGNWLTGIGLGPLTFSERFPEYAQGLAKKGVYHSQMLYMELDLEMGLLGLVSFLWLMGRTVKRAAARIYTEKRAELRFALIACCSAFLGIAVCCCFEYIWFYPRVLFAFFILLGLTLGAIRMSEEKAEV